jgi:hypothetical protein
MLELKLGPDGFSEEQQQLFEAMGITAEARQIMLDLARHAAQKAFESIVTVAETAPDDRMVNSILLSACAMLGRAADRTVAEHAEETIQQVPEHVRPFVERVIRQQVGAKPEPKQGVRDFDGKYQ